MVHFSVNISLLFISYLGKTRTNLGNNFLHPQKYALPYTCGFNQHKIAVTICIKKAQRQEHVIATTTGGPLTPRCEIQTSRNKTFLCSRSNSRTACLPMLNSTTWQ